MKLYNWLKKLFPLVLVAMLSFIPIIWFLGRNGFLINGVDINFPLDPVSWFLRRFFVWDAVANAGRDFSSSSAGLFFHLIQVIPAVLGAGLQLTQIISLVFWFGLIVFGAFILSRVMFPKNFPVQLLFVVLYAFNIYLFNTWENVKVANLSLVAAIPFAIFLLIRLQEGTLYKRKAFFYSVLTGIVVSGTGINPSYFLSFFLVVFIFALSQILASLWAKQAIGVVRNFLLVTVAIILVNLFWILPTLNFIFQNVSPVGSIDKIGFNNWLDSLSENTSLVNVIRLQGAWDWYTFDGVTGAPLYIPYALNYFYKLPFVVFSFLLPALVLLVLFFRKAGKNSLYIALSLMFVIGVFLEAGTHLPTGDFYRWLTVHLPFFTLFRSPWYIFTPLVTLSTAGLVSLLFYSLDIKFAKMFLLARPVIFTAVLAIIVGNLFYSYPLVSGKIFRPARTDGFYVNFPSYVFDAQKWLKEQDGGRIIGYPDDEIEKFGWGYRGIESILNLLASRETIFTSLNAPDSPVSLLIKRFYENLKRGEINAAENIAQKLNIEILFEKKDQQSLSPELPQKIKDNRVAGFGNWYFYKFPLQVTPKIYSPAKIFLGPEKGEGAQVLGAIPSEGVLLYFKDNVVKEIGSINDYTDSVILAKNSQLKELEDQVYSPSGLSNRLLSRDLSKVEFSFSVDSPGIYQPILEKYGSDSFGINPKTVEVEGNGEKQKWIVKKISDSYIYFDEVSLPVGKYKISLDLQSHNLVNGGDFEGASNFIKDDDGRFLIQTDSSGKFLSILNKSNRDISANFLVNNFDPFAWYLIQFRYRQIYGNNASILVGQNNQNTLIKAQVERLPNYPEWQIFSFYYQPVKTASIMKVLLSAPYTKDPLGTKVEYDDLSVFKVFVNKLIMVKTGANNFSAPRDINYQQISPVSYKGEVSGVTGVHLIVFSENYSPDWELGLEDTNGRKIPLKPFHFSANLYANAWYVEGAPDSYKFKIFYKPQRLFWLGAGLSLLGVILSAGLIFHLVLLKYLRKKKQ